MVHPLQSSISSLQTVWEIHRKSNVVAARNVVMNQVRPVQPLEEKAVSKVERKEAHKEAY